MRLIDLRVRSRRNNLIFTGIDEPDSEASQQREAVLVDFLKNYMNLGDRVDVMVFHRVHRLGPKRQGISSNGNPWKPRHIIAGFRDFKDRELYWKVPKCWKVQYLPFSKTSLRRSGQRVVSCGGITAKPVQRNYTHRLLIQLSWSFRGSWWKTNYQSGMLEGASPWHHLHLSITAPRLVISCRGTWLQVGRVTLPLSPRPQVPMYNENLLGDWHEPTDRQLESGAAETTAYVPPHVGQPVNVSAPLLHHHVPPPPYPPRHSHIALDHPTFRLPSLHLIPGRMETALLLACH